VNPLLFHSDDTTFGDLFLSGDSFDGLASEASPPYDQQISMPDFSSFEDSPFGSLSLSSPDHLLQLPSTSSIPSPPDLTSHVISPETGKVGLFTDTIPPCDHDIPSALDISSLLLTPPDHFIPPAPDITPLLLSTKRTIQKNFSTNLQSVASQSISFDIITTEASNVVQSGLAGINSVNRLQKIQKKNKSKTGTRSKVIKFHEYKGPPSVLKANQPSSASKFRSQQPFRQMETYQILLEQQQQLLQWQLESQQNVHSRELNDQPACSLAMIKPPPPLPLSFSSFPKPQINHASIAEAADNISQTQATQLTLRPTNILTTGVTAGLTMPRPTRLEDMKVSELKAECKRLNLACSGPKPNLIERLQLHVNLKLANQDVNVCTKAEPQSPDYASSDNQRLTRFNPNMILPIAADGKTRPSSIVPMEVDMSHNGTGYLQNSEQKHVPYVVVQPQHQRGIPFNAIDARNQNTEKITKNKESTVLPTNSSFVLLPQTLMPQEPNRVILFNSLFHIY
jgi:hypothetical protein